MTGEHRERPAPRRSGAGGGYIMPTGQMAVHVEQQRVFFAQEEPLGSGRLDTPGGDLL